MDHNWVIQLIRLHFDTLKHGKKSHLAGSECQQQVNPVLLCWTEGDSCIIAVEKSAFSEKRPQQIDNICIHKLHWISKRHHEWMSPSQQVCQCNVVCENAQAEDMQQWSERAVWVLYLTSHSRSEYVKVVLVALGWRSQTRPTKRPLFLPCSGCSQAVLTEMAHWHTWYKKHRGTTRALLSLPLVWLECCVRARVGARLWWEWHLQESRLEARSSEGLFSPCAAQGGERQLGSGGSTQAGQSGPGLGLCASFREMRCGVFTVCRCLLSIAAIREVCRQNVTHPQRERKRAVWGRKNERKRKKSKSALVQFCLERRWINMKDKCHFEVFL